METPKQQKAPDIAGSEPGPGMGKCTGRDCAPSAANLPAIRSPRQRRALSALLTGPKTREQIDRIAGASNSPDVIGRLRKRFGMTLPCELERIRDQDGRSVERGVYSLTAQDATKARHLLEGGTL